ncbi:MAG: 23S rRNA (adenine(2503)-C(2))-methyltransferase RlmN, partial [Planctomycetota bacterium]
GLKQNLSTGRILQQVWRLTKGLRDRGDRVGRITNLVFMGMGEPLANYKVVLEAVKRLHDPQQFGLGWRRMTLSTVGVPPRMKQLADEDVPINLALSLHAPEEHLRREIIPWAGHFELQDILDACKYYFDKTGREVTFEYILLSGVNDEPHHAKRLAAICRGGGFKVNVNLLRYNEVEGLPFDRPASRRVMQFQNLLREQGVTAHVRKSRGRDIDAACGQLRRKQTAPDVPQLVQLGSG